jgi:hypothetical protein
MATTTPNYGWTVPTSTDLVKDGATAIETLGDAIDASMNTALGTKKAGMVLLNTTSFSAVASQSVSNFTSASYSKYRIIFSAITSTDGSSFRFRFRENVTDKATGYYGAAYYARYTGTSGLYTNENNGTFCVIGSGDTAVYSAISFDFYKPANTIGIIIGHGLDSDAGSAYFFGDNNLSMTDVTGFSIFPQAGTMTGKVSVYGYNE